MEFGSVTYLCSLKYLSRSVVIIFLIQVSMKGLLLDPNGFWKVTR